MISDALVRVLVLAGGLLLLAGLALWVGPRLPFWDRLPGDIMVERGRFSFHAPLATMLLLSVTLSILANALRLWRR